MDATDKALFLPSRTTVVIGALTVAFVLYICATGSITKYKQALF